MMPVKIRERAMAMLDVKSVPNLLGTSVSYAYAVKSGPWIFLTGHEAFDFESGFPEEVAGPSGFPLFGRSRSRREGDFILQRMRRILQEFGTDLGNGVPSAALGKTLDRTTLAEIREIIATAIRLCVPEPGQDAAPPLDIAVIERARSSLKHMIATAEELADDTPEEREQLHGRLGPLDDDIPF
jgi:hypothetical protein